jgi:citrate lyase subunit beta/citryl-CoA lyase
MEKLVALAGNSDSRVRSDCEVRLDLSVSDGISVNLESKVEVMYGSTIIDLCKKILGFYGLKNARIDIKDSGALDFVIAARLEAAIKILTDSPLEFLPDIIPQNKYTSAKNRFRFSRLYLPGNTPSMMLNAGLHAPDGIILDLEDSVSILKKSEARLIVRNALRQVDFYGAERMVRINQGEMGIGDLDFIVPHNTHLVLVPKCEDPDYLIRVDNRIKSIQTTLGDKNPIYLMPIIESAMGVENAFKLATATENVVAMAIGLEDYTADLGAQRTATGEESLYARLRVINACKAAGIQPIDSVFSDVSDMEALRENVSRSKSIGFEGMGCIHPRQIPVIKEAFSPTKEEIEKATRIVVAFNEAEKRGLGVVSLGSKMIDPPVVNRALKVIELAKKLKLIAEDWERDPDQLLNQ